MFSLRRAALGLLGMVTGGLVFVSGVSAADPLAEGLPDVSVAIRGGGASWYAGQATHASWWYDQDEAAASQSNEEDDGDKDKKDDEDDCEPAKTLFKWNYKDPCADEEEEDEDEIEPIATDRPDFTENSSTVGYHVVQLEMGYTFIHDRSGGTSTREHSYPELLLRVGIWADWLEFRVGQNFAAQRIRDAAGTVNVHGAEDLYLGFKLALTEQEGILPEMALTPQMTVPTGDPALSAGQVLPGVNWLYGWDIGDCFSTGGSTQINRDVDDTGEAHSVFAQSWTVGASITECLGAYAEWFMLCPHSANTARTEHYVNGGFTWLLTYDIQFDVRAGLGLNEAAADYFIGSGLSLRF